MINIDTEKLLDQPMDRKQFLRNVGIGIIAFSGLTAAMRALGQANSSDIFGGQQTKGAASYGSSAYGGIKPRA